MTNFPKVLFQHRLQWEYNSEPTMYRMVASLDDSDLGFDGINYFTEKLDGIDAMGNERWVKTSETEGSLFLAAVGQYLLGVANDTSK